MENKINQNSNDERKSKPKRRTIMENKINILANNLEQMLADCEDNGRDGIQPVLNPEDAKLVLDALKEYRELMSPCTLGCAEVEVNHRTSPFADTVEGMLSPDYKERFKAEYIQTKIRYERLKAFNIKLEAAFRTECERPEVKKVPMPTHDCPHGLLSDQQEVMGQYLHILEVRAVIEGVDLGDC